MRPVPIQPIEGFLVGIGDREFQRGVERNDLRSFRREYDFLLDACRGYAVLRRAEGLDRKHHARLELVGFYEGIDARNERPLVQSEPQAMAEIEAKRGHLGLE